MFLLFILQKTAASCHEKRVCQLLVHVRVFGDDPCPGTTKYLTVKYKCKLRECVSLAFMNCAASATGNSIFNIFWPIKR